MKQIYFGSLENWNNNNITKYYNFDYDNWVHCTWNYIGEIR